MDHLETSIQHELCGRKGLIFDNNVARLRDFVKARENQFIVHNPSVQLYNVMTKQIMSDIATVRLLNVIENDIENLGMSDMH